MTIYVWTFIMCVTSCWSFCRGQYDKHGLLALLNGSANYFGDLWDGASFNDPYNNKSLETDFFTIYNNGDFRAAVDSSWGTPREVVFQMYNDDADLLGGFRFNVSGLNITSLANWVTGTQILFHWPHTTPATFSPTIRNNKEMVMKSSSGDVAYFGIVHDPAWPTAMLLAVNSAKLLNTATGGHLDIITQPDSGILVNVYHADFRDFVEITETSFGSDEFLYIHSISVNAIDASLNSVDYNISCFLYLDNTPVKYNGQHLSDGSTYTLHTLLIHNLTITFNTSVKTITIELMGPSDTSVVAVSMLYVFGLFEPLTTSTSTSTTTSTTTPAPTTTEAPANLTIVINGTTYCPCAQLSNNTVNTTEDLEQTVAEIVANLTVDKDSLSSNTRKYISAKDTRSSAKAMGAFGVVFIVMSISLVVYVDSATLLKELTRIPKNVKHLKNRFPKNNVQVDDISTLSVENNVIYAETPAPKLSYGRSVSLPDIVM